jgi:hypothetical protein
MCSTWQTPVNECYRHSASRRQTLLGRWRRPATGVRLAQPPVSRTVRSTASHFIIWTGRTARPVPPSAKRLTSRRHRAGITDHFRVLAP